MLPYYFPASSTKPQQRLYQRGAIYIAFWIAVGLLLAIAQLQIYVRSGGQHLWEPFLWELSSVTAVAALMPLIYRWISFADTCNWNKLQLSATHIAMACGFSMAHVGLMYGIRFLVYFLIDVRYQPGSLLSIIGYEAPKDFVTYTLLAGICYGVILMQREQRRQRRVVEMEAELLQARLATLQNQLQPHFLFNTLNLVSALMAEDVERADTVLVSLGDLLRSTLALSNRTSHTLKEELHILEPYLAIMEARFGQRLTVKIDCDEAAQVCMIPCLLLLPLIENAVHHGVEKTTSLSSIKVLGRLDGDALRLTVSANVGALERDTREGGIGLANTRARLNQIYEGSATRATIALIPLQPQGVEVVINLPIISES